MITRFPQEKLSKWDLEGNLYSYICTLDLLSRAFKTGDIDPSSFHRQHTELLSKIVNTKKKLTNYSFNFDAFLREEKLIEDFPSGVELLKSSEKSLDVHRQIDYQRLKRLPHIAAEFVTHAIELLDLLHLQEIATVERIIPYLDELYANLTEIPLYDNDNWISKDIVGWVKFLDSQDPSKLLKERDLKKLELQVSRWLADVRRQLKNF